MKKFVLATILFALSQKGVTQSNEYIENLSKYWKLRYQLLGDKILPNQVMPWENNFKYTLGEPGIMVAGTGPGMSIPANGIPRWRKFSVA